MPCPFDDQLAPLALGALPEHEAAEVRAHLATCETCSATYTELAPVAHTLLDQPGPPLPDSVRQATLAEVSRQAAIFRDAAAPARPDNRSRWMPRVAVATAACVAVGIAFVAGSELVNQEATNNNSVAVVHATPTQKASGQIQATMDKGGGLTLEGSEMASVPAGYGYRVWGRYANGQVKDLGTVAPDAGGKMNMAVPPTELSKAESLAITMQRNSNPKPDISELMFELSVPVKT